MKNINTMLEDATGSIARNGRVIGIIEMAAENMHGGANGRYEMVVSRLSLFPQLSLFFSQGAEHSAKILQEMFLSATDPFTLSVDWIGRRTNQIKFLTSFPVLGVARSIALLLHFKSMRDIVCATPQQIQQCLPSLSNAHLQELMALFSSHQ
jgi:ERCC4-type nuclease